MILVTQTPNDSANVALENSKSFRRFGLVQFSRFNDLSYLFHFLLCKSFRLFSWLCEFNWWHDRPSSVFPCATRNDLKYIRFRKAVRLGQNISRYPGCVSVPDFYHLRLSKLVTGVALSHHPILPSFRAFVVSVGLIGSKKEMRRVTAAPIIAFVKNQQKTWNRSERDFPSYAMREPSVRFKPERAVSTLRGRPNVRPTFIWSAYFNLLPKQLSHFRDVVCGKLRQYVNFHISIITAITQTAKEIKCSV